MKTQYSLRTSATCLMAILVFLCGCASTGKLSDADRKKIEPMKLSDRVHGSYYMHYLGPGGAAGAFIGFIGTAVGANTYLKSSGMLQDFVKANDVHIEKIVLEEFAMALRQSGKISVTNSLEGSRSTLTVSILEYGFSTPNPLSSRLVPILAVKCEIVDATGRTVWVGSDRILRDTNAVDSVPAEEILTNAHALETAWRAVSRIIAGNILNSL